MTISNETPTQSVEEFFLKLIEINDHIFIAIAIFAACLKENPENKFLKKSQ